MTPKEKELELIRIIKIWLGGFVGGLCFAGMIYFGSKFLESL